MTTSGPHTSVSIAAASDLSTSQYHAVEVDGTLAVNAGTAFGILQNKPDTGQGANIAFAGHLKAYAGAAVTAGALLQVASGGWLITATSGEGRVGKAVSTAGSGALVEGIFDFSVAGSS